MTRSSVLLATSLVLALGLAGCSSPAVPVGSSSGENPTVVPATGVEEGPAVTDTQGAVEFVVTPLNLASPGATIDFEVSMNTHSVDLGWDLARQSTLTTDEGLAVIGQTWPVGNGHHYEGILSFPARTTDGKPLLEGATDLRLVIRDTDVPERVFTWELSR